MPEQKPQINLIFNFSASKNKHSEGTKAPTITHQHMPNPPIQYTEEKKHKKAGNIGKQPPCCNTLSSFRNIPYYLNYFVQTQKNKHSRNILVLQKMYGRIKLPANGNQVMKLSSNQAYTKFKSGAIPTLHIISTGKSRNTYPFRNNSLPKY